MADALEHAKETLEHARHASAHPSGTGHASETDHASDNFARNVAIMVGVLAAALSIAEMGAKSAQNAYLTHHIAASDDWAFYQAKNIRSNMYTLHADLLDALPAASDPEVRKKIEAARGEAKRLDDDEKANGRKQLAAKAVESQKERDHAFHRYHLFEFIVGALQISIVLSSVAIVAKVKPLALLAGAIGAIASLAGIAVAANLI